MRPKKTRQKASQALIALLVVGIALPGITVQGEPETLPDTDPRNNVFVDGSVDKYVIQSGHGGSSGFNSYSAQIVLTAPNGQSMGISYDMANKNALVSEFTVYLNGTVTGQCNEALSTPTSCVNILGSGLGGAYTMSTNGNLSGAPANGTWVVSWTIEGSYRSGRNVTGTNCGIAFAQCSPGPNLTIQGKSMEHGVNYVNIPSHHQTWNWHVTDTTWLEPSTTEPLTSASIDPPNEAPDEDPNNARFYSQAVGAPEPALNADTLGFTVSSCSPDQLTVQGFWSGGNNTANYLTQFAYAPGDQTTLNDLRNGVAVDLSPSENQGMTSPGIEPDTVIAYDNLLGTSYQFIVDNNGTEALGSIVFAPSGLCDDPPTIQPPPTDPTVNVTAQTTGGIVDCSFMEDLHTIDLMGTWRDGDNATNYTTWFYYLNGSTTDTDLSMNMSATQSSVVNHGVLTPGSRTITVPYTEAGLSFQFFASNNGTTDMGNVLFAPENQCLFTPQDFPGNQTVLRYILGDFNFHFENVNPADYPAELFSQVYDASKRHDLNVQQHRLIITVESHVVYEQGTDGEWQLTIDQDDQPLGTCDTHIETLDPGVLGGNPLKSYTSTRHCLRVGSLALNNLPHVHEIQGFLNDTTGTPDTIIDWEISIKIEREDIVDERDIINPVLANNNAQTTTILEAVDAHNLSITQLLALHDANISALLSDLTVSVNGTELGNFSSALDIIIANLTAHRSNSVEIMDPNSFNGLSFDGFLMAAGWIIVTLWLLTKARWFAATGTSIMAFSSTFDGGSSLQWGIIMLVIAAWLEILVDWRAKKKAIGGVDA